MPHDLIVALVGVFAVHLVAFGRLAVVRRSPRHALVATTFLLLCASFGLRLYEAPGAFPLRVAAWVTAAASLAWWWAARQRSDSR